MFCCCDEKSVWNVGLSFLGGNSAEVGRSSRGVRLRILFSIYLFFFLFFFLPPFRQCWFGFIFPPTHKKSVWVWQASFLVSSKNERRGRERRGKRIVKKKKYEKRATLIVEGDSPEGLPGPPLWYFRCYNLYKGFLARGRPFSYLFSIFSFSSISTHLAYMRV